MKLNLRLTIFLALGFGLSAHAENHYVKMKSVSYDPKNLTIKVGDEVEWTNSSLSEHSASTKDDPSAPAPFDTGLVAPKKTSKLIKFTKPGSYSYHCAVHGKTMSGEIVVER